MAWDKDPVTLDEFLIRLKTFHVEHPDDARVLINGDSDASYSTVIYALDEVRKAGIQKVLIETRAAEAQRLSSTPTFFLTHTHYGRRKFQNGRRQEEGAHRDHPADRCHLLPSGHLRPFHALA